MSRWARVSHARLPFGEGILGRSFGRRWSTLSAFAVAPGSADVEVLVYRDPVEGFHGFCVFDRHESRLAAGGCRIQRGLTEATLRTLAAKMTLKERVLGLVVDGAKCGIDYDPHCPGRVDALRRFMRFLRPELETRLSMGCDMGTRWNELERIAAEEGFRSVKIAIQRAQELSPDDFSARLRVLDQGVGILTLGERRAGHALACAVITAARLSAGSSRLTCTLQGFGNLGRAAAHTLVAEGARLVAVADEYGCVAKPGGLDVGYLLSGDPWEPLRAEPGARVLPRDCLPELTADVCILAAGENGLTEADVDRVAAPVVVVGANGGLSPAVELALTKRGVLVIPDVIGGIGGPASMEGLFGPERAPSAEEVLLAVQRCMDALVDDVLCGARTRSVTPRRVAEDMAAATRVSKERRPYGHSIYLAPTPTPRGNRGRTAGPALISRGSVEGVR